jgi:hypothetical protein
VPQAARKRSTANPLCRPNSHDAVNGIALDNALQIAVNDHGKCDGADGPGSQSALD